MSQVRKPPFTRSSLACLSCRSRHQKCDAKKPECTRCGDLGRACEYTRSRRGANGSRGVAAHHKQVPEVEEDSLEYDSIPSLGTAASTLPSVDLGDDIGMMDGAAIGTTHNETVVGNENGARSESFQNDIILDAFYENFHKFHPVVFPRRCMVNLMEDPSWQSRLRPLLAVMRLIGNLYHTREWSRELQQIVETYTEGFSEKDPIQVQYHLLYSVALFWQDQKSQSQSEMAKAVEMALQARMFEKDFASHQGGEDMVLQECWRRTWWMVYVMDAFYAGTLGKTDFSVLHIEASAELPCEEWQYESGRIPRPRSLREWENREFDEGGEPFSSFAHLIGAVKCAASAKAAVMQQKVNDRLRTLQVADSILDSWILLLPPEKKQVMSQKGDIDELLFQAHLLIHVAMIGFHRPLSDLKFNAVEDISSCAREPAPNGPTPEHINVHTVRVLRAAEAQVSLMALPSRPFNHTPFCTCMISEGTLALLSACKFLLRGTELAITRDQIRLTIGCLKSVAEIWPRTARNVSQIQTIARHVLSVEPQTPISSEPGSTRSGTSASETQDTSAAASQATTMSPNSDILSSIKEFEDVCGWYDIGDLDSSMPWWPVGQDL